MADLLEHPFDEALLKEVNRLVTEHTLSYRVPGAIAGEYTSEDMAAGDTVFGDHETLIARVPDLMSSTQKALDEGQHPLLIIRLEDRAAYISALRQIRTEGTDEHLIAFFFHTAISRMKEELSQKHKNAMPLVFF